MAEGNRLQYKVLLLFQTLRYEGVHRRRFTPFLFIGPNIVGFFNCSIMSSSVQGTIFSKGSTILFRLSADEKNVVDGALFAMVQTR